MSQSAKVSNPASPPFATPDGKATNQGTTSKGGHDFLTEPSSKNGSGPGNLLHDRPQSEAKPEVAPNKESIPSGGAILKADPTSVSKTVSGNASGGVQGVSKTPFKSLK